MSDTGKFCSLCKKMVVEDALRKVFTYEGGEEDYIHVCNECLSKAGKFADRIKPGKEINATNTTFCVFCKKMHSGETLRKASFIDPRDNQYNSLYICNDCLKRAHKFEEAIK